MKGEFKHRCRTAKLPCTWCRQPISYDAPPGSPDAFEADHLYPVSTHPQHAWNPNLLRPAHGRCNRSRGAKPPPTSPWVQANWG